MRKQDSLFNAVVEFVNEQPIGSTFSTQEYLNRVSGFETLTGWKSLTRNDNYRAHMYKGMMKRYFLTNPKRGSWTVTRHVPEWFTSAHLWTLNGYTTTDTYTKDGKWASANRTKLSKDEIALKLTAEDINTIVTKLAKGMADESVIGNKTPEDPMFYASGAYFLEKAIEKGIPKNKISMISGTSEIVPQIKITKIEKEESQFYINENRDKEVSELYNNIRENVGLVRAATHIMDQVRILDPLVQGRAVNIFEQLQSLLIAMESRIISNTPKQSI
jgi:hypothetical protein